MGENYNKFSVDDHRTFHQLLDQPAPILHPPQLIVTPTSPNSASERRSRLEFSHSLHSIADECKTRSASSRHLQSPSPHSVALLRRSTAENIPAACTFSNKISDSKIDSSRVPQTNPRIESGGGAVSSRNGAISKDALGISSESGVRKRQQANAGGCLRSPEDNANVRAADNKFAASSPRALTATATNTAAGLELQPQ